jgi:hypothetical protein
MYVSMNQPETVLGKQKLDKRLGRGLQMMKAGRAIVYHGHEDIRAGRIGRNSYGMGVPENVSGVFPGVTELNVILRVVRSPMKTVCVALLLSSAGGVVMHNVVAGLGINGNVKRPAYL